MEKLTEETIAHRYALGLNNKFSAGANQKLFFILGIIFITQSIFRLFFSDSLHIVIDLILGGLLLAGGIAYLIYAYYGFSGRSKYAPRIETTEDYLLIKSDFFKGADMISWEDVKSFDLGHYSIGVVTENGKEFYNYCHPTNF